MKLKVRENGLVEEGLRVGHQVRAEPEHEGAELHLVQSSIAVEIALSEHAHYVVVGHPLQPHQGSVGLQALEGYHPLLSVHQQLEPVPQLLHEPLRPQLLHHRRKVVLEHHPVLRPH